MSKKLTNVTIAVVLSLLYLGCNSTPSNSVHSTPTLTQFSTPVTQSTPDKNGGYVSGVFSSNSQCSQNGSIWLMYYLDSSHLILHASRKFNAIDNLVVPEGYGCDGINPGTYYITAIWISGGLCVRSGVYPLCVTVVNGGLTQGIDIQLCWE